MTRATESVEVLVGNMDARVWAREFSEIAKNVTWEPGTDDFEGWMIGWFANAIMTGYDRAKREESEKYEQSKRISQSQT